MYGLLRACCCSKQRHLQEIRRLAYCGTCKSLGALFGQASRLLLNHDTAFLAELLLALQSTGESSRVDDLCRALPAYRSYHCMVLPAVAELPRELLISACVNAVLVEFKLRDQLVDSPGLRWRLAARLFSGKFASAARQLENLNFPLDEAFDVFARQVAMENEPASSGRGGAGLNTALLQQLCQPTSLVTALFFEHSARACGLDSSIREELRNLGGAFGELVYLLDALEDLEADGRKGQFNAVMRCSSALPGAPLDRRLFDRLASLIRKCLEEAVTALSRLPLDESIRLSFCERFQRNTELRLAKIRKRTYGVGVSHGCRKHFTKAPAAGCRPNFGVSAPERFKVARARASGLVPNIQSPLDVIARFYCFLFVWLFPAAEQKIDSLDDCLEMPFNLIFLSSIPSNLRFPALKPVGAFASGPGPSPGPSPFPGRPVPPGINREKPNQPKENEDGCCRDCCDSECRDCCDCPCNCGGDSQCGCCECNCGHCDCGHCDCGHCDCGSGCHGCDGGGCDCSH